MAPDLSPSFSDFLDSVDDPRMEGGNLLYPIQEVLFLVTSAVLCGFDSWVHIELFGNEQLSWLRKFFPYANGIPSHDCLGRLFGAINHEQFTKAFTNWAAQLANLADGEVIAIDGKCVRRSHDQANGKTAIHLVSAFACTQGITLGQQKVDDKSNEIIAIPLLLESLMIKGCVITIDAMGCQRQIVEQIIDQEADYVIAVKENQGKLFEQVQQAFATTTIADEFMDTDAGHGRVESRKCQVISNLRWIDESNKWPSIKAVAALHSTRYNKSTGEEEEFSRFYICSIIEAKRIHQAVRSHWQIENQLHWVLDVAFDEDACRKRVDQSAQNSALITKVALNLLRRNTFKGSIKSKRMKAVMNTVFREELMFA